MLDHGNTEGDHQKIKALRTVKIMAAPNNILTPSL